MKDKKVTAILLAIVFFVLPFSKTYAQVSNTPCVDIQTIINLGNGGSKKASIILLQNFLRNQGYFSVESSGYFGPITFNSVKAFQKARGLQTVGTVGPLTRAEIKKISCVVATVVPVVSPISQVAQVVSTFTNSGLPYRAENFSEWTRSWGIITKTETNSLILKSADEETSVQVVYPFSKDWTDYRYTASVSVSNGNIMLIGRKVDDKNLLICAFSGNNVQIQQRLNDKIEILDSVTVTDMASGAYFQKSLTVSMRVKGDTVGCSLVGGDDNATYVGIDSSLMKGGIGIQTWYAASGGAKLELFKVSVENAD